MRLKELKMRELAGEYFVIVQGRATGDSSRVVSLNATSLYLWNALHGWDFAVDEVSRLLVEHYQVDALVARRDAEAWIEMAEKYGLIDVEGKR